MKISIKQAGIIVAIFAIIALALVGCFCAISVKDSTINSVLKKDDVMTTADKEYLLQGECDEMAEIWNAAITESIQHNRHIKLTLMNDWVAKDGGSQVTMFGEGIGFEKGRIRVVEGAVISLDLNGFSIDRNLTNKNLTDDQKPNTAAMRVYGTLNLLDSQYDIAEVNRVYEQYKNQDAEATNRVLLENLSKIKCGKITGSDTISPGTAGIHVDGTFNMYGGMIIGNKTTVGAGAGVQSAQGSVFNMYNGAVVGNSATIGGGILSNAKVFNIQGGLIAENQAKIDGGGIIFMGEQEQKATISDCIISHNRADNGGGVYSNSSITIDINNVEFIANYADKTSSAIYLVYSLFEISNTKFKKNIVGSAYTVYCSTFLRGQLKNIEISDNVCRKADIGGHCGGAAGLGVVNSYDANREQYLNMNNVLIEKNIVTNSAPHSNLVASGGMLLNGREKTMVDMQNVRIVDNVVNSNEHYAVGGFVNINLASVRIIENVVIDGNKNENGSSNLFFRMQGQKLMIPRELESTNAVSRIGVTFGSTAQLSMPFTLGYSIHNNNADPNKYFYSDNTDKLMATENGEVKLGTETRPTQTALTWRYKANSGDTTTHNITGSTITLEYNPSGYTITNSANNVVKMGVTGNAPSEVVNNVGRYVFTITNPQNYTTPTLIVVIVPKKVDIVWSNTELTYNGALQAPTATIADDEKCTITITGGQMNVCNGYIATATSLSDSNYEINPTTSSTMFSIKPADLTIDFTTNSYVREYNGKVASLPNDWYSLSATLLGRDENLLLDLVFDIDYNAFIPQFNGKDSAIEVGEYTISTKRINADDVKNVFSNNLNYNVEIVYKDEGKLTINKPSVVRPTDNSGYDFVLSENGRRVNYKDKDLIHGDNDSAITTFVLGNITPNTSVQTFVNNLSFDTTKITIYNKAGEVVYGAGAISYYTDNANNGLEVAIGTGWRIEYTKLTGGEETIYLSVLGDLTGDGKVNAADVNYIRQLISNPAMYADLNDKPYIQLAALLLNNGKLTNADGEILWNVVCGKMSIADII